MLTNPCRKRRLGNSDIRFQRRRTLWPCKPVIQARCIDQSCANSQRWLVNCCQTIMRAILVHSSDDVAQVTRLRLFQAKEPFSVSVQRSQKSSCSNQTNVRNQNKTPEESSHDKWFWFSLVINNSILITGNVFCFPMVFVSDKQDPSLKASRVALTGQATQMMKNRTCFSQ